MKNYEVFIIVAVLAGIGYYFWQSTKDNPPPSGGVKVVSVKCAPVGGFCINNDWLPTGSVPSVNLTPSPL